MTSEEFKNYYTLIQSKNGVEEIEPIVDEIMNNYICDMEVYKLFNLADTRL